MRLKMDLEELSCASMSKNMRMESQELAELAAEHKDEVDLLRAELSHCERRSKENKSFVVAAIAEFRTELDYEEDEESSLVKKAPLKVQDEGLDKRDEGSFRDRLQRLDGSRRDEAAQRVAATIR